MLLEVAPQAARIACSTDSNRLPLHEILFEWRPPAELEMVAMLLAAYKEAVNIPDAYSSCRKRFRSSQSPEDDRRGEYEQPVGDCAIL